MDHETTSLFCRPLMGPDEYILWQGRPGKKGRVLFGTDLAQLIFAIVWTFLYGLDPSAYFIIIFPLVGVGLIIGQFYKIGRIRNHTEYVLTNKRLYRRMGKNVDSYEAVTTLGYETKYHRNGNATISFPMAIDHRKGRVRVNGREIPQYVSLLNIGDVERVQQALSNMSVEN